MSQKITETEKNLTAIRMPKKYLALFAMDLAAFFVIAFLMADQSSALGFAVIGMIFLLPVLALFVAYFNYVILFDRKNIIYRNFFRVTRRYTYDDLRALDKNGGIWHLHCADGKKIALFPNDPANERFLRLAEKAMKK